MSREARLQQPRSMSEPRACQNLIQGFARGIEKILPPDACFILLAYAPGSKSHTDYVSNGKRQDLIRVLRGSADDIENKAPRASETAEAI